MYHIIIIIIIIIPVYIPYIYDCASYIWLWENIDSFKMGVKIFATLSFQRYYRKIAAFEHTVGVEIPDYFLKSLLKKWNLSFHP